MSDFTTWYQSTKIVDDYIKYRPTYGPDLFESIISFCLESEGCDFSLALDLGCGSGQSSVPLTKHFKRVIGLDVSQAQLDRAPKDIPNLSFRVGPAEDLSFLEDGSVDLVTVATAIHWMDVEKLFPEVERVLKPGGAFVVYTYSKATLDEAKAQELNDYYWENVLKPCSPCQTNWAFECFKSFYLPFPGWQRNDSLKIIQHFTVDEFMGYLSSMDPPSSCTSAHSVPMDSITNFIRQGLGDVYRSGWDTEEERRMVVTWPLIVLMGNKPHSC